MVVIYLYTSWGFCSNQLITRGAPPCHRPSCGGSYPNSWMLCMGTSQSKIRMITRGTLKWIGKFPSWPFWSKTGSTSSSTAEESYLYSLAQDVGDPWMPRMCILWVPSTGLLDMSAQHHLGHSFAVKTHLCTAGLVTIVSRHIALTWDVEQPTRIGWKVLFSKYICIYIYINITIYRYIPIDKDRCEISGGPGQLGTSFQIIPVSTKRQCLDFRPTSQGIGIIVPVRIWLVDWTPLKNMNVNWDD